MMDALPRFVVGGVLVTALAIFDDLLCPNSIAGLFGTAPSVALACVALTLRELSCENFRSTLASGFRRLSSTGERCIMA
jgi:hypothetical protein